MTGDLFETLDKAGFGANVTQVASQGDCRVLRLDDKTGEGFMTMYRLFDGVYLMYNDFHLRSCVSQYQNAETMLCIDHCREGRIEHENSLHEHYYMDVGTIRIDKRVHHEGKVELPLSHYHGMTIGFVSGEAEQSLCREMPFLSVDLKALGEIFCPDNKEFLIRENEQLSVIFSQLYHAPKAAKLDYFRVKTVGLIEPLLRVMAYSDDIAQMDTIVTEVRSIIDAPEMVRPEKLTANINGGDIVLDEATANVDPENEAELVSAIEALTREKTIIMIAHRLKTVRKADNIIVVESGRIAQQGTHEQLMAQQGIYRTFVESRREAASWRI